MENPGSALIKKQLHELSQRSGSSNLIYRQGHSLYLNGQCTRLSSSENHFEFSVNDKYGDYLVKIDTGDELTATCECEAGTICRHRAAAMMQLHELIRIDEEEIPATGIKYTRSGMIKRVVEERKNKALHASYAIQYADNAYGEHVLTNERGIQYKLTFRDIDRRHGYCSCPDYKTNKLGTCKHLIFAFEKYLKDPDHEKEPLPKYPFIEVFLNPFRDYKISWFYPEKIFGEVAELFYRYFDNKRFIEDEEAEQLLGFFNNLEKHKQILVRPEVYEKVDKISELVALQRIEKTQKPDLSLLKSQLLPYQRQGVEFATFKKGALIADEIGLGKTVQAIATALMKKLIFGFSNTLIICPAIMKLQWKHEIESLCSEKACIVEGKAEERNAIYSDPGIFFKIVSYETMMRDKEIIRTTAVDFIILDEAERIRNYASPTASVIKSIPRKHALVLSDTPVDSELIDLYSIILFVDPDLLTPLWEFSYQHCYFDSQSKNNIVGYYNLEELKEKLKPVLIRRERQEVIKQLPNISQVNIPVRLSAYQKKLHISFARDIIRLAQKKVISAFDLQNTLGIIKKMRMLVNSTFLIDDASNIAPKLDELKHILSYKLHIKKSQTKTVIFTEWDKMLNIIARMLRLSKIPFIDVGQQAGSEEQKKRFAQFEADPNLRIFLCTPEAAHAINLSAIDTVINMEVSPNAKEKNKRLGSIDSLRNRKTNLTIINLIGDNSLEAKLAGGLEINFEYIENLSPTGQRDHPAELAAILQKGFTDALAHTIEQMILSDEPAGGETKSAPGQMKLDFAGEEESFAPAYSTAAQSSPSTDNKEKSGSDLGRIDTKEMDTILQSGLEFLSQLLKLSTGKNLNLQKEQLHFDPESGEITLKFKIPQ